ncbi:hypothetical protein CgunFtcFv8_017411 [Champsocephalus gunnari]|nr:hypothetical protein CgunFtcFv8_017411 [Champsocephalus gunnari]
MAHLKEALMTTSFLREDITQAAFNEVLNNKSCTRILNLFDAYLSYLRQENGSLSAFWMTYVDMVEVMLGLIRASREGDWMLHLASIRAMIPWCFAHDKLNYARYLSYYYAVMSRLHVDHPEVYAHFMRGGMIGRDSSQQLNHTDLQLPRIKKDEKDVNAFVELMENSWINPLSHDHTDLVSLSTGMVAPPDVANGLRLTPWEKRHTKHSKQNAWRQNNQQ